MNVETLTISRRFCGPSASGNGGYVCGRLARHIAGTATVRLFVPPPLESTLQVDSSRGVVTLLSGAQVVAEGKAANLDIVHPPPPSFEEATEASKGFRGFKHHSFPNCFVCGPLREQGDGMRIFAGPLKKSVDVASPWIVDASLVSNDGVPDEFVWAALDCPSAFAVWPTEKGKTIVLGQLTARIDARVQPGDRCVAMAWPIQIEGRKRIAGSAIFSETGQTVAVAQAIWIEVPEDRFPEDASAGSI